MTNDNTPESSLTGPGAASNVSPQSNQAAPGNPADQGTVNAGGATTNDVVPLSVGDHIEIEGEISRNARAGIDSLHKELGPIVAGDIIADARRALADMPQAEREAFEFGLDDNGYPLLNSPAVIKDLAKRVSNTTPGVLAAAMRQSGRSERAELENLMQDRGSIYWRGGQAAELQRRYRTILRAGGTGAAPSLSSMPADAGVDAEIARIEEVMRNDRSRYNRDENLQAKYRELLTKRAT